MNSTFYEFKYLIKMKYFKKIITLAVFLLTICVLTSCSKPESKDQDEYLIRIGQRVVTVLDFNKAFEIAEAAFPHNVLQDSSVLKEAKKRLLNQMTEEMVLLERAKELGVSILESEVDKNIAEIKSDYPEGVFEDLLLEYAVSYESWKKGLKTRMLIEKLIEKELSSQVVITADDISRYYEENYKASNFKSDSANRPKDLNEKIVKYLRRKKIEEIYKSWIEKIHKRFHIEINEKQWKRILSS
ncbi:MAG: hypothetical protein B6I22_08650 [Desulfobacteraceae bacterium 4572_123]|nr:MAG: hypothetical protein B6I22_08650 [Desulfobacteraceae bacterium 4572_123]